MQQAHTKVVKKTENDWVGKVIYWELCKRFKFAHMNKWYMYKLESVQENETHKGLYDFEKEMHYYHHFIS